jgi:hypothetical protein
MSSIILMSTIEEIKDCDEYYISDNVYFSVYEYDVRWFTVTKRPSGKGHDRRMVMEVNTYPNNPRMFIRYIERKRRNQEDQVFIKNCDY